MKIKYKGECLTEDWNKDLTPGKEYELDYLFEGTTFIIDDIEEIVTIGDFRISEFEIVGGKE